MVKESVIYQNILLKGWRQGWQEGWQEGWQKRRDVWIKYLLNQSLIEDNPLVLEQIRRLSPKQLETLLDFSEASDVKAWLEQQVEGGNESLRDEDIWQQGRWEGEVAWIRRKLEERLGEIDESVMEPLRELSVKQLEALSEEFSTFLLPEDVVAWLKEQVKVGSQPWFYQAISQHVLCRNA